MGHNPKSDANLLKTSPGEPWKWKKGQSANPGGKVSLTRDLERAAVIGVPPEVTATLKEWLGDAADRLADLGPDGFIVGLTDALEEACRKVLPLTPSEARAMWWRCTMTVQLRGPQRIPDPNWTYANSEVGNRLLGKAKEHVVFENGDQAPIDWKRVPEEEREGIMAAIAKLQGYVAEPEPTEH